MTDTTDKEKTTEARKSASQPARAAGTAATRFGTDGDDTDGQGTGGMVEKADAGGGEPRGEGPSSGVT